MGFYDWLGDQLASVFYPGIDEANEALAKPIAQMTEADRGAIKKFEQSYEQMSPTNAPVFNSLADTGGRQLEHLKRGKYGAFLIEGVKGEFDATGIAAKEAFNGLTGGGNMGWMGYLLWGIGGLLGGNLIGNMVGGGNSLISTVLSVGGVVGALWLGNSYARGELSQTFNSVVSSFTGPKPENEPAPARPKVSFAPAM